MNRKGFLRFLTFLDKYCKSHNFWTVKTFSIILEVFFSSDSELSNEYLTSFRALEKFKGQKKSSNFQVFKTSIKFLTNLTFFLKSGFLQYKNSTFDLSESFWIIEIRFIIAEIWFITLLVHICTSGRKWVKWLKNTIKLAYLVFT